MTSRVASVLMERSRGWSGDHDERRRNCTRRHRSHGSEENHWTPFPRRTYPNSIIRLSQSDGKRNCVLRRKVFAVRDDAIISPPSSRWNPVQENAAQGDLDVLLADEFWNHESLTVCCSQSCGLLNLPERVVDGKQCRTYWGDSRVAEMPPRDATCRVTI